MEACRAVAFCPNLSVGSSCGLEELKAQESQNGDLSKGPPPVATLCAQEKSHIEVFKRPLSGEASALVFFSRRTDMPYRYHSSLSQLNYTGSKVYEVSALASSRNCSLLICGLQSQEPWGLRQVPVALEGWSCLLLLCAEAVPTTLATEMSPWNSKAMLLP